MYSSISLDVVLEVIGNLGGYLVYLLELLLRLLLGSLIVLSRTLSVWFDSGSLRSRCNALAKRGALERSVVV